MQEVRNIVFPLGQCTRSQCTFCNHVFGLWVWNALLPLQMKSEFDRMQGVKARFAAVGWPDNIMGVEAFCEDAAFEREDARIVRASVLVRVWCY
jgi:hypothetical protein